MRRPRFYYGLKPYLPWRIRLALRRVAARRERAKRGAIWPIDPASGTAPDGWPGWPQGKKFAFVITHDVEGKHGLSRCRRLAEVEMEIGFKSSFNFIPEGPYSVPPEDRQWLTERGFEVGVHDLHHDGKLYESRSKFREKAHRINRYLGDWKAKGFRSGFMLHELDWIHDLDVLYDCSTFDTDPFEPQPDPAGTIFPFWVPTRQEDGANSTVEDKGYVELPYTLPQDSTLFSVFQEKTPEIWIRKLDWIAAQGGMALINVHPDYLTFAGNRIIRREYPVEHYTTFLWYLKDRYAGQYWHALPEELATWYQKEIRPRDSLRPPRAKAVPKFLAKKRAAVLLYSYYPSDSRPRRAAEAMIEAGMDVDLLCLKEEPDEAERENIGGVNVFRTPITRKRGRRFSYVWKYGLFFMTSALWLVRRSLSRRYDVIHVHNMPDFLVFAALPQKLAGTRVILDLHDPMPELMKSIYELKDDNWQIKLLRAVERRAINFANVALTPNITFRNLFVSRSCTPDRIRIVMNSPEETIFDPASISVTPMSSSNGTEFRIMHHGSIVRRHGIDLLVRAVARARIAVPGIHLDIYGRREPFLDEVLGLAAELNVAEIVHYHGAKTPTEIGRAIQSAHLGIIPNRRSSFTETNFPTRIFEYLAMHRPVIAPSTQGITDYFKPSELVFFEQDNLDDLVSKIVWVRENPSRVAEIVTRGIEVYRHHLWREEKASFLCDVAETLGSGTIGSHLEQLS
jgi:glycosyltransferase involved in cell wall biosynthesis